MLFFLQECLLSTGITDAGTAVAVSLSSQQWSCSRRRALTLPTAAHRGFLPVGLMAGPWDFSVRREVERQKLAQQLFPQQPREEDYKQSEGLIKP